MIIMACTEQTVQYTGALQWCILSDNHLLLRKKMKKLERQRKILTHTHTHHPKFNGTKPSLNLLNARFISEPLNKFPVTGSNEIVNTVLTPSSLTFPYNIISFLVSFLIFHVFVVVLWFCWDIEWHSQRSAT